MLFLIFVVLNLYNCIQRIEQVLIELDISAIEDYILLLPFVLYCLILIFYTFLIYSGNRLLDVIILNL